MYEFYDVVTERHYVEYRIRNKIIQTGIPYQVMASLISIRRTSITAQK